MTQFRGVMQQADAAVVFFSKHALTIKRLPGLDPESVRDGFDKEGLLVFDQRSELEHWLAGQNFHNSVLLLMSSGNYDGIDIDRLTATATHSGA